MSETGYGFEGSSGAPQGNYTFISTTTTNITTTKVSILCTTKRLCYAAIDCYVVIIAPTHTILAMNATITTTTTTTQT